MAGVGLRGQRRRHEEPRRPRCRGATSPRSRPSRRGSARRCRRPLDRRLLGLGRVEEVEPDHRRPARRADRAPGAAARLRWRSRGSPPPRRQAPAVLPAPGHREARRAPRRPPRRRARRARRSTATRPRRRSSTTCAHPRRRSPPSASAASKTRAIARRRRSGLNTLPTAVFGSSGRISRCFGTAAGSAMWPRACASSSSHVGRRPGDELDVDRRQLAGMGVRLADRAGEGDRRMLHHRLLDQRRVDVVAAADDQVLGPAGDPEIAVGVEPPEVAGAQIAAVGDDAAVARRFGVDVGVHAGVPHADLADLVGGALPQDAPSASQWRMRTSV